MTFWSESWLLSEYKVPVRYFSFHTFLLLFRNINILTTDTYQYHITSYSTKGETAQHKMMEETSYVCYSRYTENRRNEAEVSFVSCVIVWLLPMSDCWPSCWFCVISVHVQIDMPHFFALIKMRYMIHNGSLLSINFCIVGISMYKIMYVLVKVVFCRK